MSNSEIRNIHLITGGAGFIGSNLISYLLDKDQTVICIDDFSSSSRSNLKSFTKNRNFSLIEKDITETIDIKVGKIWHLACPASPAKYILDPLKTLKTGFIGTLNMLELAKKYNSKFLLSSSSEIYSKSIVYPQVEDYMVCDNPFNSRSCYVESKRISETLCFQYKDILDLKIARIFNTYGRNMLIDDGRVISNFIKQALQNKPLTIYGSGNQTRSFCYIDDLILGLIELMDSKYNFPLNLGDDYEISILEVAKIILKRLNKEENFKFEDPIVDEPKRRCPDLKKTHSKLNWKPKTNLNRGLDLTIKYFIERYFNNN